MTTRRQFLRYLAFGAAGFGGARLLGPTSSPDAVAPMAAGDRFSTGPAATTVPMRSALTPAHDSVGRILVVLEMQGGVDGMSLTPPYGIGSYYDLRPNLAVPQSEVIAIDHEIGLHPRLVAVSSLGPMVVQGIGAIDPDGSHFEMADRWAVGDGERKGGWRTGFLGRLADLLDEGGVGVGLTIDARPSPSMPTEAARTLAVGEPDLGWFLRDQDEYWQAYRAGIETMIGAGSMGTGSIEAGITDLDTARRGLSGMLDFAGLVGDLPEVDEELFPDNEIGWKLALTTRFIAGEFGTRVVHVPWGSFDTHTNQVGELDWLFEELDPALGAFFAQLDRWGLGDRVMLATASEFGRRPAENDGGTDHGRASNALVLAPGATGRVGELPSLTALDENDNLDTTVPVDNYLATLAEDWLGVPAAEVLSDGQPLGLRF